MSAVESVVGSPNGDPRRSDPETSPTDLVEPVPDVAAGIRELRLALVCYGGVSLAIYMHGVTKELEKLLAASVAYEDDQQNCPFDEADSAAHYWHLLNRREKASEGEYGRGVRTRVVIDIISGTSAGGINGVFLAAAIARNRTQDPLRQMWMDKGDIRKLLRGWNLPLFLKTPRVSWSLIRGTSLLDGDRIARWLREALGKMGPDGDPIVGRGNTLLAPDDRLQLFVPVTDFYGYETALEIDEPVSVAERTHRHVMRFVEDRRNDDSDQLSSAWDDGLAFAARATSSFPAAFPPLSLATYENAVSDPRFLEPQRARMFAEYRLGGDADGESKTFFIDGGVLDNKPFGTTIAAIKQRPAAGEVDRRLIYIEPDPSVTPSEATARNQPDLVDTVVDAYAGIPRQEPILGDLNDLAERNAGVRRVRDIIETNFEPVRRLVVDFVESLPDTDLQRPVTTSQVAAWRTALAEQAATQVGLAYPTYLRLRLRSVIDDFATMIITRRGYPASSRQARFITRALGQHALRTGLLSGESTADEQAELLDALDIDYRRRHLRFLIAGTSWWYRPGDQRDVDIPDRELLDPTKHALTTRLVELERLTRVPAENATIDALADQLFGRLALVPTPPVAVEEFVSDRSEQLLELQNLTRAALEPRLQQATDDLDRDIATFTAPWPAPARRDLLTRHLGFAIWDTLLYPIQALSGIEERDQVEVMRFSPHESTVLASPEEKELEGVKLGHFGAFFSREGRENDYLWGRLDAAERLTVLLATKPEESTSWFNRARRGPQPEPDLESRTRQCEQDCRDVARRIVDAERPALKRIGDQLAAIEKAISEHGP